MQTATESCPHVAHAHACFQFNGATVNLMTDTPADLLGALRLFGMAIGEPVAEVAKTVTENVKPAGKPKAEKAAAAAASAEPAPSPAPAPAADAKQSAAAETPKAKAVDYPTLQAAVFKLAGEVRKKGLDQQEWVVAIAKGMNAPTFKELPADQWGAALEAVNAQLAKVEAVEVEVA